MAVSWPMNYEAATHAFLDAGMTVFQGAMLAASEADHCRRLYDLFQPTGTVVDLGCGIGGVLAAFAAINPDLELIGVTNSPEQQRRGLPGIRIELADMAATGLPDACADLVMFNESFGYAPARQLLDEAARLLRPGGRLAIKDFAFEAHNPVIGQCERRWGYTVHEPEALALYAQRAGFAPVVQRHLAADFARWHRFMDGYPAADEHRHASHGPNIHAAVYMFEKPRDSAQRPRVTLAQALQGHAQAIAFCSSLHALLHLWDDLIDRDRPVADEDINAAFRCALVDLPLNLFFRQHAPTLAPVIAAGISAWEAANHFEAGADRERWRKAHMLRVHIGAVFVTCAELVGGYEWGRSVAPAIYDLVQGDTLAGYLQEMERKHADRNQV